MIRVSVLIAMEMYEIFRIFNEKMYSKQDETME